MISVIVPTRGDPARLARLLDVLAAQTLARERWELVLALDGAALAPALAARAQRARRARGAARAARAAPGPRATPVPPRRAAPGSRSPRTT